ncbi:MAG TPA: polysaccharide deacetylase family protein, partial [Chondromyces sp.]|nr:polysaccharide deacetylase family protein [Chondromyces sp.]
VLQILDDTGVKATFFLTGREIEENQAEAKKIAGAGHELANHSYSHARMVFKSPSFIKTEIERTDQLIREAGYEGPIAFRPPYGKKFVLLPYYLKSNNRETILWNLEPDSLPELTNNPKKMMEYVNEHIEPGSIILMHVMYESREPSLQAVEGIIQTLKEKGYTFTTVTELLDYK